jgi:hypothetical protein
MSDVDNSGVEDPKDEEDGKDAASAPSGAPSTEGPPMTLLFPQSLEFQHETKLRLFGILGDKSIAVQTKCRDQR